MSDGHPGELLIVGYEGLRPPDELGARITEGRVGGVILFARNIGTPVEVAAAVAALGRAAPAGPPLIVTVDQEGGRVQRIREPLTRWPPMAEVAARRDPSLTRAVGAAVGTELRRLGFNLDLAPVLDVRSNPDNQVIGDRAFGEGPDEAAEHALAFFRGLESAGVRGCGKHFPGHGDTLQDSHEELPRIDAPWERFESLELKPFAAAVAAGVPMMMTAHIVYSAVDELPATMSPAWIDGVLRRRLGFAGVVVSDDLDMKAVSERFSVEEVVEGGLRAGVDMFLACRDPERQARAEEALCRAAKDPLLGPRVTTALGRARALRATLAPAIPLSPDELAAAFPDTPNQALSASLARPR